MQKHCLCTVAAESLSCAERGASAATWRREASLPPFHLFICDPAYAEPLVQGGWGSTVHLASVTSG